MTTPRVGPVLFSVPAFDLVTIPAASEIGPTLFRFPRALFVTGVLLLPDSGLRTEAASLRVRIQDATFQDLISDGQGFTFDAPSLAMGGMGAEFGLRPFAMQQPVAAGDEWFFTVSNRSAADILSGALLIYFEEPRA